MFVSCVYAKLPILLLNFNSLTQSFHVFRTKHKCNNKVGEESSILKPVTFHNNCIYLGGKCILEQEGKWFVDV